MRRLLVVAAGNAETITDPENYPYVNLGPPHLQQPGQAWNVLTISGYTDLDRLTALRRAVGAGNFRGFLTGTNPAFSR